MNKQDLIVGIQNLLKKHECHAYFQTADVKINRRPRPNNDACIITISKMYDYVDISFQFLEDLSLILKTNKINIYDRNSTHGCETCDYGSSYRVELEARDIPGDIVSYDG